MKRDKFRKFLLDDSIPLTLFIWAALLVAGLICGQIVGESR